MTWDCAQLEERLTDYLDAQLAAAELTQADAHARACARCREWFEARRAAGWLRQLEPLETPPGLETRILALTVAPPPRESIWQVLDRGWRALYEPRFAFGLAGAVFSLALVLSAFGFSVRDVRAADVNPVNIYRTLDRQGHQAYAWGVRFVNELRLVYEIRSRLEEPEPEPLPPAKNPEAPAPAAPEKEQRKNPNSPRGARQYWLLAGYHPAGIGVF